MPQYTPNPQVIRLPVFAGHGTSRTSLKNASDQAIRDAESPLGSLLLSSCLDAFLTELAALTPEEIEQSDLCALDFDVPLRLLAPNPKYAFNHIISGVFLFAAQVLRYQSYVQPAVPSRSLLHPLQPNVYYAAGVLGLSSGIFPACVVAASYNPISYITNSVEIIRLVFWISLRVSQLTRRLFKEKPVDPNLPWSVTCLGLTKIDVEQQIARFQQKHPHGPSLRVTAVLDEKNVTISGRPDLLVKFSTFASAHCTIHPTTVDALYHSDLHLPDTRGQILADIHRRNIRFPDYQDLRCPVRSTISGDVVRPSSDYPSLVELVVDTVLVHPVNWDLVAKKVASVAPADVEMLAVNIGPGTSALRALQRVALDRTIVCIDASSDTQGEAPTSGKQEPIAIIGMAAHTPGATNTAELWEILERGVSTVSKIPYDRFKADDRSFPRETMVETGNFMSDFADFDHKFFKISPRETKSMDPQQRVLLHTAYEALENAGYVPDATPCFRRARFGCYVGAASQDYADTLANNIDIHYSTGTLRAFLSGRISHAMQWGGPSVVVDTACSASIVAIYQACRALMNRDCDAALAGGVNVMASLRIFVGLERGHFLNRSGQCKTFDASADGYSRGEGCCLFVLKRLCDAVAENDHILGVIRGIEVNQSGLAQSITHPHSPTQTDLLKTLLEHSGVCPTHVSVVEAHGTGTEAGDSCELSSIRSVFCQGRARDNPLHVSSIKPNIGHLEASSGAVGLCKLLLMLQHNVIPAQISLKTLNPLISPLEMDNTVISTLPIPWAPKPAPRLAVLNNYGAAGSNGALILEEYIKPKQHPVSFSLVFGLSAKSARALENLRSRHIQWLRDPRNQSVPLCDIAYTATARRQLYPFRLAVTASDKDQLVCGLATTPVTHVELQNDHVVFVFSGQGSQYPNMGASLYATSSVFKRCIDRCHHFLLSLGYPGILAIISSEGYEQILGVDEEFEVYHCAVLAVEYALATLWKNWGVTPAGVIGHSLGEYAALVIADVLTIETALSIVAKRARLMSRACAIGKTGMVSISLSASLVQDILSRHYFTDVTIACVNSEFSCVVSGPVEELKAFTTYLMSAHSCKTTALGVQLGFHSPAVDPVLDDLSSHVQTLAIKPPTIPIASNVYGTVIHVGDSSIFQAGYFAKQCRQPVLFSQGLKELEQFIRPSKIGAWIDFGPHAICLSMVRMSLSLSPKTLCLPTILKGTPAWETLVSSMTQLYRSGVPVNWRRVFDELGTCSCVELPTYPFESQKFWATHSDHVVCSAAESTAQRTLPGHPMLSSWFQYPSRDNNNTAIFETPIRDLARYIEGHRVSDYALCPASVYLEQALTGAVMTQCHMKLGFGGSTPALRNLKFTRPLVFHRDIPLIIRTRVTVLEDGTGSFRITSQLGSSHEEVIYVHGDLHFHSTQETLSNMALELPGYVQHAEAYAMQDATTEKFTTHGIYEVVFPRIVEYAKEYRTIQSLTVCDNGGFGTANIVPFDSLGVQNVFLDTLLHVPGFMVNMRGDVGDGYICSGVDAIDVLRDMVEDKQPYILYCSKNRASSQDVVDMDILAVHKSNPPVAVAHVRGVQFYRVRLTTLYRNMATSMDPRGGRRRARTSPHLIAPPLLPGFVSARARSNTHGSLLSGVQYDQDAHSRDDCTRYSRASSPVDSPQTLVCEDEGVFDWQKSKGGSDMNVIRKVMAEVLGIAETELEDDTDLSELGLDSLGSIEAQQALRIALSKAIPHDLFSKCTTITALCAFFVDSFSDAEDLTDVKTTKRGGLNSPESHAANVALVQLQRSLDSEHAPLYLIHDGSGHIGHYERLSPLNRDVWGISNPRFFDDEPWNSLEDMAHAYAQAIERHATRMGLILGGWSFGGVVAFEMAHVLASRGFEIKGVVLIDSPSPSSPPLLSDTILESVLQEQERTVDASAKELILRQFRQNSSHLRMYLPRVQDMATGSTPVAFLRCTSGFYPKDVEMEDVPAWFRERDSIHVRQVIGPWEALIGASVPVWDVPGNHFEPFLPLHVKETSAQLDRACRHLETH